MRQSINDDRANHVSSKQNDETDGTTTTTHNTPMNQQEKQSIQNALRNSLPKDKLTTRFVSSGVKLHYVETSKVVDQANEIFGYDGWSNRIIDLTIDYIDEVNGRYSVGASAIVRVSLKDGTWREDIGYGVVEHQKLKGEALEQVKKKAVTDGLKRALRLFGNALGLNIGDHQSSVNTPRETDVKKENIFETIETTRISERVTTLPLSMSDLETEKVALVEIDDSVKHGYFRLMDNHIFRNTWMLITYQQIECGLKLSVTKEGYGFSNFEQYLTDDQVLHAIYKVIAVTEEKSVFVTVFITWIGANITIEQCNMSISHVSLLQDYLPHGIDCCIVLTVMYLCILFIQYPIYLYLLLFITQ
jgi:DNA repair and recombination protein RAD52